MVKNKIELAMFGGECFWCTEAVFNELKGVIQVVSGYTGGTVPGKPTYKEICSGLTGHAEVVKITFNANIISYKDLLVVFMTTHDPTRVNKQGADIGSQYRSVIYYYNTIQKEIAIEVIESLASYYNDGIVTEVSPINTFYEAEDYHQKYYSNNKFEGYCTFVITPKLNRLRKLHSDKLK